MSCADCKWWNPVEGAKHGVCGGIDSQWDWRSPEKIVEREGACMIDRNAELLTMPGFWCANETPKSGTE